LHKATIPKIKAKIQHIIQRIPPMIVRHKNHQTKAKTKLAMASQFHQFVFSSIFLILNKNKNNDYICFLQIIANEVEKKSCNTKNKIYKNSASRMTWVNFYFFC
jgi:hypothetical protein